MYNIEKNDDLEKNYKYMNIAIKDLLTTEKDEIACLSNITSFINSYMKDLNWVGFYLNKDEELVLAPFQGMPACIRIKIGKGVCGTSAKTREVIRVENVHEFEGHIACDSNTNSEIVLPIVINDKLYGVLDLDSPKLNRFTKIEENALKETVKIIEELLCVQ